MGAEETPLVSEHAFQKRIQVGPGAPRPLPPRFYFEIMQISGNLRETPCFEKILGSGPPSAVKTPLGPLAKILDPRLLFPPNMYAW